MLLLKRASLFSYEELNSATHDPYEMLAKITQKPDFTKISK